MPHSKPLNQRFSTTCGAQSAFQWRTHALVSAGLPVDSRTLDPKEQDRHPQGATQQGQKTADLETATSALVLPAGGDAVTAKQESALKLQSREPTPFSSTPNS